MADSSMYGPCWPLSSCLSRHIRHWWEAPGLGYESEVQYANIGDCEAVVILGWSLGTVQRVSGGPGRRLGFIVFLLLVTLDLLLMGLVYANVCCTA